jgi:hypothetical protein
MSQLTEGEFFFTLPIDSSVFYITGSMVPFALRWMHAELPHRTGQMATTIERLYALLDYCNSKVSLFIISALDW